MDITDVRVKLVPEYSDRLLAYCSITIDGGFVIRDLKLIDGPNGPFVAMPSRRLTARCPRCGHKNHLRSCFCNDCGRKLQPMAENTNARQHADIAHPINAEAREYLHKTVLAAFDTETQRSNCADYQSSYGDDEFTLEAFTAAADPVEVAVF